MDNANFFNKTGRKPRVIGSKIGYNPRNEAQFASKPRVIMIIYVLIFGFFIYRLY